jgi:hypothetical protein
MIFAPTNNIYFHGLTISSFVHPNPIIHKFKSYGLPTPYHLFSYIKRKMRDKERKEKERRRETTTEIKTEISPSQL